MKKTPWKDFEEKARICLQRRFKCSLSNEKVFINGKGKKLDLVNKKLKIAGDVKNYCNTKGGNSPEAKRSILNEYVWILQKLPKRWKKLIVLGEDISMAKNYIRDYDPWLNGVTFYFYHRKSGLKLLKK